MRNKKIEKVEVDSTTVESESELDRHGKDIVDTFLPINPEGRKRLSCRLYRKLIFVSLKENAHCPQEYEIVVSETIFGSYDPMR